MKLLLSHNVKTLITNQNLKTSCCLFADNQNYTYYLVDHTLNKYLIKHAQCLISVLTRVNLGKIKIVATKLIKN